MKFSTPLILLFFSLALSCSKSEDNSFEYKYAYYPLSKGYWLVYNVDSIKHTENGQLIKHDTFRFQVKEVIDSSFLSFNGEMNWQISVFTRKDSFSNWTNQRVGVLKKTVTTIQRDMNGINLIKLVFPPNKDYSWNTNVFNNESKNSELIDSMCVFTEIDQAFSIGGLSFDSTIVIVQADYEDLINKGFATERYAKNVGLIYRNIKELGKQNASNPWSMPETGYDVTYTIHDFKR